MPNLLSLINDPSLAFITRLAGRGREAETAGATGGRSCPEPGVRAPSRQPSEVLPPPPPPPPPAADWRGPQHQQHLPERGGRQDWVAATASGNLSSLLARPRTFPSSNRVPARHRLDPFLLPAPPPPPPKWRPPAAKKATSGPDQVREAGASFLGSRGTIAALEALRSPRPSRQDASYLVPREERVFVQDGPAGLRGRRRRGALHAALAEPEQPLRLLRGAGRLLSLYELPGGRRWGCSWGFSLYISRLEKSVVGGLAGFGELQGAVFLPSPLGTVTGARYSRAPAGRGVLLIGGLESSTGADLVFLMKLTSTVLESWMRMGWVAGWPYWAQPTWSCFRSLPPSWY